MKAQHFLPYMSDIKNLDKFIDALTITNKQEGERACKVIQRSNGQLSKAFYGKQKT